MSKKYILLFGILLGLLGIGGLLFWTSGGKPSEHGLSEAVLWAAEPEAAPKLAKASHRTVVWDWTPLRKSPKYTVGQNVDIHVAMNAGRFTSPAGIEYHISLEVCGVVGGAAYNIRMTVEDAAALLQFYKKTNEKAFRDNKESSTTWGLWACDGYYPTGFLRPLREAQVLEVSANEGRYTSKFLIREFINVIEWTPDVFDTLADTLKDVDAMKAGKAAPRLW